jgi:hypothetical protein
MAFLIMAYKDPAQIERLVKSLSHENFDIYIHLDKKVSIKSFAYLSGLDRTFFTQTRKVIHWAGYSFVQSVLNCMEEILHENSYDFISVISGQDYPIKSVNTIYDFFNAHKGTSFLSYVEPVAQWWEHARLRYEKYHLTNFSFKGRYLVQWVLNSVSPKRTFPFFGTLYGGPCATWWSLSTDCAKYVVQFMKDHPEIGRYANFTWAPDELLIPSIIMNSPFRDKIVNDNRRYIDWSQGGANPKILTVEDFDSLMNSSKLLARKFDVKVDARILDLIDNAVHSPAAK